MWSLGNLQETRLIIFVDQRDGLVKFMDPHRKTFRTPPVVKTAGHKILGFLAEDEHLKGVDERHMMAKVVKDVALTSPYPKAHQEQLSNEISAQCLTHDLSF